MFKNKLKGFIYALFILIFLSVQVSFATNVSFTIDEVNIFKDIDDGKYQLYSQGSVEIRNPSNFSKIYEVEIPLELESLMGISKIRLDSSTDGFEFSYNRIAAQIIEPGSTARFGYEIFGVVNYDLEDLLSPENLNQSVFQYYSDSIYIRSNSIINLGKVQREGETYLENGSIDTPQNNSVNSSRIVSVNLRNPTDFTYIYSDVKLYESTVGDPMFSEGGLVANYGNFTLNPFGFRALDYYGLSSDYAVFWTSSNPHIATQMYFDVEWEQSGKLADPESSSGGSSSSSNDDIIPELQNKVIVKKEVDKSLVLQGDEVEVTLRIVNLNNARIYNLTLFDEVPSNYNIKDVSSSVKIVSGSKLVFDINSIEEYGTYVIQYTLVNNDAHKGITFLKPASVEIKEDTFYSEGVLLVNDLLPNKKIFVQKEVEYEDDDYARVTITVRNLGSVDVEDILVSDIIDENSIIRDISQVFLERGVWRIKRLEAGDSWEVTYLVERNSELENLPNLFGVEEAQVYQTLIQSEEIVTIFREQPRTVETVGMALAVGLLIFYLLF